MPSNQKPTQNPTIDTMEVPTFTVREANAMIPFLNERMGRMLQVHGLIRMTYLRLDEMGCAPDDDDFAVDDVAADSDALSELGTLRALVDTLQDDLVAITETGCQVKSVESGLVDWVAIEDNRQILLCWKYGETAVSHWHELDDGFAGRQPVELLQDCL